MIQSIIARLKTLVLRPLSLVPRPLFLVPRPSSLVPVFILIYLSSCTSYKEMQYLQGNIDSTQFSQFKVPEQRIQKGDQISIAVFSENAAASSLFNSGSSIGVQQQSAGGNQMGNAAVNMNSGTTAGAVYDVDQEGNIFFPQVGKLNVEGLTRDGIKALLDSKLKDKYLINPYYVIRFLNLKITVFGDVKAPGIYPLVRENTNIFEALTLAGDLTEYGKRDNILIIREKDGKRIFARIDVTKPDVFNSPYYYLQQNDMVFVDMRKSKANRIDETWTRNVSLGFSIISLLFLIINSLR
jgi:polysaccharide export outer membrane protein